MRASGGFELTIATLIAAGRLDERLLHAARGRLASTGLGSSGATWIDEGDAVDLEVTGDREEIRRALEGWEGVDVIVHPDGPRQKRLLVADMDSTIIGQECIDELADFAGIKPQVAAITERAMRGELDFVGALEQRVSLLAGLAESVIAQCLSERVRPNPGAGTLVRTMTAKGAETLLVSGGFTGFVQPVAEALGFSRFEANTLEIEDSKLTGKVIGKIVDAARKRQALEQVRAEFGLSAADVLAVGDGANDGPMIVEAGLGVAYRAKPALVAVADARLDHHGLDALLWVQGISRRDWVIA
jgi:phosphoserine phosphatase